MTSGDWVPERYRERVEEWSDTARRCAGTGVQALVAFGPHVSDPSAWDRQPLSTVLVLAETDLELLRRLAAEGDRLGRRWISAPLIMSPAFIQESLDTFPLELLDIHQQHRTIFGADPFAELTLQAEHLRLQCERECKVLLTRVRQGILGAAGHESLWAPLTMGIAEQVVRTLRGLLWLRGVIVAGGTEEVMARFDTEFRMPMRWVQDALLGSWDAGWSGIQAIYRDIEKLSHMANDGQMHDNDGSSIGSKTG